MSTQPDAPATDVVLYGYGGQHYPQRWHPALPKPQRLDSFRAGGIFAGECGAIAAEHGRRFGWFLNKFWGFLLQFSIIVFFFHFSPWMPYRIRIDGRDKSAFFVNTTWRWTIRFAAVVDCLIEGFQTYIVKLVDWLIDWAVWFCIEIFFYTPHWSAHWMFLSFSIESPLVVAVCVPLDRKSLRSSDHRPLSVSKWSSCGGHQESASSRYDWNRKNDISLHFSDKNMSGMPLYLFPIFFLLKNMSCDTECNWVSFLSAGYMPSAYTEPIYYHDPKLFDPFRPARRSWFVFLTFFLPVLFFLFRAVHRVLIQRFTSAGRTERCSAYICNQSINQSRVERSIFISKHVQLGTKHLLSSLLLVAPPGVAMCFVSSCILYGIQKATDKEFLR